MSLYRRAPGFISLAGMALLSVGLLASTAQATPNSVVQSSVSRGESTRASTLGGNAVCINQEAQTWKVDWTFETERDGNDVVILSSTTDAYSAGEHLMPPADMPDGNIVPVAHADAASFHTGQNSVTQTLTYQLLPQEGTGFPIGTISATVTYPCALQATTTTTEKATTTTAEVTTTTAEVTTTTAEVTTTTAKSTTTSSTPTTIQKATSTTAAAPVSTVAPTSSLAPKSTVLAVTVATKGTLPSTGSSSGSIFALGVALTLGGLTLVRIDRKRNVSPTI